MDDICYTCWNLTNTHRARLTHTAMTSGHNTNDLLATYVFTISPETDTETKTREQTPTQKLTQTEMETETGRHRNT